MKAGARQERTLFYQKHLYERVLPFWLQNGVDSDYGGYFTCFSNYGDELVSTRQICMVARSHGVALCHAGGNGRSP